MHIWYNTLFGAGRHAYSSSPINFFTVSDLILIQICIKGDYVIQVGLHGYDNPTNRLIARPGDRDCCDGSPRNTCSGFRRCDNRFSFCVRPSGTSDIGTASCSSAVITSTETNSNDADIDFNTDTVLGLDNPLLLQGITTAWEVQCTVTILTLMASSIADRLTLSIEIFCWSVHYHAPLLLKLSIVMGSFYVSKRLV